MRPSPVIPATVAKNVGGIEVQVDESRQGFVLENIHEIGSTLRDYIPGADLPPFGTQHCDAGGT
jgi:hypothetical protein